MWRLGGDRWPNFVFANAQLANVHCSNTSPCDLSLLRYVLGAALNSIVIPILMFEVVICFLHPRLAAENHNNL